MAHWSEKRTAQAMVGAELARRGWTLYGWTEDKSDSMTDYYAPEHWDGVAEKAGAVVVVDADAGRSGYQPMKTIPRSLGVCARCKGERADPGGWTLAKARETPAEYNRSTCGPNERVLFSDVVSPLPFFGGGPYDTGDYPAELAGRERCRECHGKGERFDYSGSGPDGPAYPIFQANPPNRRWHVERGGRIVASGAALYHVAGERYNRAWRCDTCGHVPEDHGGRRCCPAGECAGMITGFLDQPKLAELVDKIEAAAFPPINPNPMSPEACRARREFARSPEAAEVRDGKRPGFVEIAFPGKPDADVRAELKASGFRWAPSSGCWYGKADQLPARYA